MSNMNRDYDRMARRRRTQRKSMITTIIAGAVIIAAVIAIIIVILALIKNNNGDTQSTSTEATSATSQPTLYIPPEQGLTPSQVPTQQASQQPGTEAPAAAPTTPTEPDSSEAPTEAPDTPVQTDAPADNSDDSVGDGSSYTDANGVLHVFTPSGYSWTYYYDADRVKIACEPHYDVSQYEFLITGLQPGRTEFNVYYYTDSEKKNFVKIPVVAEIDDSLRVVRVG